MPSVDGQVAEEQRHRGGVRGGVVRPSRLARVGDEAEREAAAAKVGVTRQPHGHLARRALVGFPKAARPAVREEGGAKVAYCKVRRRPRVDRGVRVALHCRPGGAGPGGAAGRHRRRAAGERQRGRSPACAGGGVAQTSHPRLRAGEAGAVVHGAFVEHASGLTLDAHRARLARRLRAAAVVAAQRVRASDSLGEERSALGPAHAGVDRIGGGRRHAVALQAGVRVSRDAARGCGVERAAALGLGGAAQEEEPVQMRGQAAGVHVDVRRPVLVRAELRLVAHALALSVEARDAAARRPLAEEREPHLDEFAHCLQHRLEHPLAPARIGAL
mmetsp:Transcript_12614/g.41841  ORF Transcript_12614/g.41841 Transcript_12614/m.41841 type:complete len:330 (-) Transcript_12614:659-1648(-)